MDSKTVKIRLRNGEAEIEIEGPRGDVDQLLGQWWKASSSPQSTEPRADTPKNRRIAVATGARRSPKAAREQLESSLDPVTVANAVKESEHFDAIEQKILHAPRDIYHKVAFVIWFAEKALTSGDVYRVLSALHVRLDLASISRTLKSNMKNLTTDKARKSGGPPATYQLTAKARSEFEKWLLAPNEK